ncbi:zinc finger protein 652-like isoform X1 [Lineus longissimus]|uniref:zinc finger protein 652-like isoform X1 n=1 Tax=Lineus longissimus TaxID=88925 RepID=UPI002B4F377A
MAELEEAEVVMSPPTKSPSNKVQDLQAKGDVLAKAWMDLFSSVTEYQAELALKESLLDIAEMEIATRKKQQEEMRTVIEGGDEAVAKLQNEMAAKETERLQMQLELKTKEQLLESVQSDLKNSKQSNETLQSDVAAKERQLQHIQLELNSKEQLLQSVQSDLKNCKLLNEKFNQKKSELMGSQTEIASLKSDLIMKNSLYTKLSEEHEELKHDLDIQVKTVELERKSLEMERKAHDMTKRSLVYASGNRSPSAPLKVKTDDSNDHEDGMDNGMDDEDGNVVSDVASPSTSPEKPMRVSKRKKNPSARVIAPKPDASPKTVRFVVRKGGKGNIVSLASSSSPGSSTEPMVTQPSQTTSTDTPASTSEVYFPLTLSVTSSAGGGDVEDMVLVNEAATSESAPGTPMGGPPTKKSMIDDQIFILEESSLSRPKLTRNFPPKKCPVCKEMITSKFQQHVREHGVARPFKCPDCPQEYKNENGRDLHHRIKHQGLPRKPPHLSLGKLCPVCNKVVKRFELHMRRHMGDTSHDCPICQRGFYNAGECRNHMKRTHTSSIVGKNICTNLKCGKTFRFKSDYRQHIATCAKY